MFNGLTRSLGIVLGFLVAVPALVIWATEGSEWLEKFQMMNPIF